MTLFTRRKFLSTAGLAIFSMAGGGIFAAENTRTLPVRKLKLKTLAGDEVGCDAAACKDLTDNFKGALIKPNSADYDITRPIWNARIDHKPGLIARCTDSEDIATAIRFARRHDAQLSIRSGGHNHVGFAVSDGGVMLDLRPMNKMDVYPDRQIASVQPGITFADFDSATHRHGLATTGAIVSMVGIPGYTLGGGIGWLHRRAGLACDNLLAADIVTASGESVRANEMENSDLYWALRGGGGNFGVVSNFYFKLHHVPSVLAGLVFHPLEDLPKVAKFVREFNDTAPDELCVWLLMRRAPSSMRGDHVVAIAMCYAGNISDGERITKPLREFGSPLVDLVKPRSYAEWQRALDPAWVDGFQNEWKGHYLDDLSDDVIDTLMSYVSKISSPLSDVKLAHLGGAVSRVDENATAFSHRNSKYAFVIQTRWRKDEDSEKHLRWTEEFFNAMHPLGTGKVYVNFIADEGPDRVKDAYNANTYRRLQEIKRKYDPENIFRLNQNITPA